MICSCGFLEDCLEKTDYLIGQVGDVTGGINMGVSEMYMATSIDRGLKLEKDINSQLMHLSLVDICGAHNHYFKLVMQLDEKGRLLHCNNAVVNHIFNSNTSFKLI